MNVSLDTPSKDTFVEDKCITLHLAEALNLYEIAIKNSVNNIPQTPNVDFENDFRTALLIRERISTILENNIKSCYAIDSNSIKILSDLDKALKDNANLIVSIIGREKFINWRESIQPNANSWWWKLDETIPHPYSYLNTILNWMSWGLIAISLSYIIEVTRVFLSAGTDFLSIFIQGVLALIAGGTLFQGTKKIIETGWNYSPVNRVFFKNNSLRYSLVIIIVLCGLSLYLTRPGLSTYFNNWGEKLDSEGKPAKAIFQYQRAVNLEPTNSSARYNLANAYEEMLDYEKAMNEYKNAILNDEENFAPYNNLARLYITQRNDYLGAVSLLNKALTKKIYAEQQKDISITKSKIYKNLGWANLGLKNYVEARSNLQKALQLSGENAEAFCLLAQVQEEKKDKNSAKENWQACRDMFEDKTDEIDARWIGLLKEKLEEKQ